MTNQEILEKAIWKAIDAGWLPYFAGFDEHMTATTVRFTLTEGSSDVRFDVEIKGRIYGVSGYRMEVPSIIFNHDFAKALWGEQWRNHSFDITPQLPYWNFHLREMVAAEDRIKYLGENI